METLRKLLNAECDYRMADETMDMFFDIMLINIAIDRAQQLREARRAK